MARILIVEDEAKIARFVELELTHEGHEIDKAADGRAGVDAALSEDYDLILLDVLLPQLNGLEVLRRIRRESTVPVIMLTARDAVMDKVAGLDAGADDYITKPFAIEELLARIRVALKRRETASSSATAAPEPAHHVLSIRGVTLDVERHEVKVGDDPIELTNREFEVLKALMENRNVVMTRDRLAHVACGYDFVGETNIIDVYIRHLRSKIDDRHGIKLITTVRGVGYVIRED
ncbi:MAG: response regulator transcription factor [Acidobacteriota bacterium]|nr:response regulator transcription factor [Acidobacteriota bacterium]